MEPVKIYTAYDPPPKVGLGEFEESKTRQSDAQSADVGFIMARYEGSGIPLPQLSMDMFADVSMMGGYREALHAVREAEEAFMQLPAKVRARFENDPAAFVDFMSDPANEKEAQEMGLLEKPAPPAAPAVSEAPKGPAARPPEGAGSGDADPATK